MDPGPTKRTGLLAGYACVTTLHYQLVPPFGVTTLRVTDAKFPELSKYAQQKKSPGQPTTKKMVDLPKSNPKRHLMDSLVVSLALR